MSFRMILFKGAEKGLDDWAGHADLTPICYLVNMARLYTSELLLLQYICHIIYIAIKKSYVYLIY